jgi:two-component system phosphate regulon response regulator OmpR
MTAAAQRATDARARRAHILVVDDDKRIRTLLSRYLVSEGYLVSAAADVKEASERLEDIAFDLIILDVMMPGENGVAFAARLREGAEPLRSAPILMLTALTETHNRVSGLEAGADDYLAKPFDPRELSLRVASILRRSHRPEPPDLPARFGEFTYDFGRDELLRGGEPVRLTTRERGLLRVLAGHRNAIVSRETLAQRAQSQNASERSVDVEIARLRRKIESDPSAPRHLQTVRGQGYRLLVESPGLGREGSQ